MLIKIKLMDFEDSKSLKLSQAIPECIKNCAKYPHTSKLAYKNYEVGKNDQNT